MIFYGLLPLRLKPKDQHEIPVKSKSVPSRYRRPSQKTKFNLENRPVPRRIGHEIPERLNTPPVRYRRPSQNTKFNLGNPLFQNG